MLAFYGTFLFTNNGGLRECWDIFIYKPNQNLGHFHLQVTKRHKKSTKHLIFVDFGDIIHTKLVFIYKI